MHLRPPSGAIGVLGRLFLYLVLFEGDTGVKGSSLSDCEEHRSASEVQPGQMKRTSASVTSSPLSQSLLLNWAEYYAGVQGLYQHSPYYSSFLAQQTGIDSDIQTRGHSRTSTEVFDSERFTVLPGLDSEIGDQLVDDWLSSFVRTSSGEKEGEASMASGGFPNFDIPERASNPATVFEYGRPGHGVHPNSGSESFNTEASPDDPFSHSGVGMSSGKPLVLPTRADVVRGIIPGKGPYVQSKLEKQRASPKKSPPFHLNAASLEVSIDDSELSKSLRHPANKSRAPIQQVKDEKSSHEIPTSGCDSIASMERKPRSYSSITRNPATPTDICKLLSKSLESSKSNHISQFMSGSDTPNSAASLQGRIPPQSPNTEPILIPRLVQSNNHQQQPQPQQPQPQPQLKRKPASSSFKNEPSGLAAALQAPNPNVVLVEDWEFLFRMPQAHAPAADDMRNVFKFPGHKESDPTFVEQLKEFRKSITTFNAPASDLPFVDYSPEINTFWEGKNRFTDSPPIRVFKAPPIRQWIPVRCDALRYNFQLVRAVDGHAGKPGGSDYVTIVYDTRQGPDVQYIMKEFHDLEYFTNELNFFQFANHKYLPKPICVEYGKYPKIVMEYIEGERVSQSFFELAIELQSKHPKDFQKQWHELLHWFGLVLAMLLSVIKYIHSIGFIHGDIKPENIIYNYETNRLALIDFNLTVSAPYSFTGRGSPATVAPEIHGFLRGPVHFGIDWWAFGNSATIILAFGFAGILHGTVEPELEESVAFYAPFSYNHTSKTYSMKPLPSYFPVLIRSFIYPFFSPDPSKRVFSQPGAYNWIRSHPIFRNIRDWSQYDNTSTEEYESRNSSLIRGFSLFSERPVLLREIRRRMHRAFSFIFGNYFSSQNSQIDEPEVPGEARQQVEEQEEDIGDEQEDIGEEEEEEEQDNEDENGEDSTSDLSENMFHLEESPIGPVDVS